ncbi:MAG TPA: Gfo/Idh/MocA family oxidoreductase [Planctomycetota bacterium]|nr:Gfo/Idh/MocA family oxidoreductase [Planctomycetota bacterium]
MKPNLSRRQFLVHSASFAGASLGLGVARPGRGEGAMTEMRIGFIGVGDRGKSLLGALLRNARDGRGPCARVVAIADVNPAHLKRALEIARESGGAASDTGGAPVRGFTNYRALLDEKDLDAVFIATPVHLHAAQAITSIASGRHVYLEKPVAGSAEECRQVLAVAREVQGAGQIVQIGLQRRYNARYRTSIRFVKEGGAGNVLFVRAQWHAAGSSPRNKPWLFQKEKSGDIVVEQACHQFDVFNWLFDATPERACGFGGTSRFLNDPPGRDTMDHYGAVLEYPRGIRVHLSHVSFAIPDRRFSGIYELVFGDSMGVDLSSSLAWSESGETRRLDSGSDASAPRGGSDTQSAVEAFLESIATRTPPEASVEAGCRATMAALLCQRALETGRAISWNELYPA